MDKQEFIKNFGNQFDDTDTSVFTMETRFRELEEWSSLVALAVLNMIAKKYEVKLTPDEMKPTKTIQELYDLVLSKK
ncbi:putative acyl carrier protein [uncultured Paludibacter sp.]|uniref:Putative acyl carrier protein n=1 Tax=uncultured Paludibacter sp. TaxID=497635 RepID=A0A653A938_9BACT|nr:putative acyl carrier protein [uncultured Paludibacter sp.]